MLKNTLNDNTDLGQKAFDQFQKIAAGESRDFAYNLAYRRLVPQFSTAPTETTATDLKLIEDAAKLGHAELVQELGAELLNWSRDNGYHHN